MQEPSLYALSSQNPGAEAYRLLWLRSDQRPVSIRFVIKPKAMTGNLRPAS
jgi:hypothetical protein